MRRFSTIVTERRSHLSSGDVGGIWGLGHTISLVIAGVFVLLLTFKSASAPSEFSNSALV
jgi:hypothetical protein